MCDSKKAYRPCQCAGAFFCPARGQTQGGLERDGELPLRALDSPETSVSRVRRNAVIEVFAVAVLKRHSADGHLAEMPAKLPRSEGCDVSRHP